MQILHSNYPSSVLCIVKILILFINFYQNKTYNFILTINTEITIIMLHWKFFEIFMKYFCLIGTRILLIAHDSSFKIITTPLPVTLTILQYIREPVRVCMTRSDFRMFELFRCFSWFLLIFNSFFCFFLFFLFFVFVFYLFI